MILRVCWFYNHQGFIMKGATKQVYYQSWESISRAVEKLVAEPTHFQIQMKSIITSAFGSDTHQGLIHSRIDQYYSKPPASWGEEMDLIINLFSPEGKIFSSSIGIIARADQQISISPDMLPKTVRDELFVPTNKESAILQSLKRKGQDKFVVGLWQWFWLHVAYALVNSYEIEQARTFEEQLKQDEMFYIFSRSPLLLILSKSLNSYRYKTKKQLFRRIKDIFELFFIEDLLGPFSIHSESETKYQLKSHHLAVIFLLVHYQRTDFSRQRLTIYHQYFKKVASNFQKITAQSKGDYTLRNFIRVWTFFITRESGLDWYIINQLQAVSSNGYYRMERCPLQKWVKAASKTEIPTNNIITVNITRMNIYRLLKADREYSYSFLTALEQFIQLDKAVVGRYTRIGLETQQLTTLSRSFQRILSDLGEKGVDTNFLYHTQNRLNEKFEAKAYKKLNLTFAAQKSQVESKTSESSPEQRRIINSQNYRMRSAWEYPQSAYEFKTLLKGSLWLSTKIDKLILGHPGHPYPSLNLRFLANPYILLTIIVLLIFSISLFGGEQR